MTEKMLTAEEKDALLDRAKRRIARAAGKKMEGPEPPPVDRKAGAFVSLHTGNGLRGCIGTFETSRPLTQVVDEMAEAASRRDPRFPPVAEHELGDLSIEISVLSPRREIRSIEEIEVGRHGLCISLGFRHGVLLPQVAVEYGWSREEFLEHLSQKAGLPPDAWKNPAARIEVFEAEVFGEHER